MAKKMSAVLGGVALFFGLTACSGGGPDFEEGLWEITTDINMAGMAMKIPAMVHRQCLTRKDVIPRQGPADQEICTYSSPKIKGNRVSWSGECLSPGGKTRSDGEITYQGTSFTGTLAMSMSGVVEMSGINQISGRRIGGCQ